MFIAMVVKTNLCNVQNLYYLKPSLTGKAAECIKNLTFNDTTYKIINDIRGMVMIEIFCQSTCANCFHVH